MKAYLIDPANRTISPVEMTASDDGSNLADMYRLLDCSCVDVVRDAIPGHDIWVDDEGLLYDEPPHGLFYSKRTGQTLAGRGLILSVDAQGDCQSSTCSVEEIGRYIWPVAHIDHEAQEIRLGRFDITA